MTEDNQVDGLERILKEFAISCISDWHKSNMDDGIGKASKQILALFPIAEAERRARKDVVDWIRGNGGLVTFIGMHLDDEWQSQLKKWHIKKTERRRNDDDKAILVSLV